VLDPERQHRYESSYTVTFPNLPSFKDEPSSITLHQHMGKHDVLTMYYGQYTPTIVDSIKTGAPVKIVFTNNKVKETFVGYATGISYPVKQAINKGVTITCVGSSYVLKDRPAKIWTDKTAPQIITDIATLHKLKPVVTPHPYKFSQQSLAGHSYWEKTQELATRIGYACQVKGTELHFHPVDKMIDTFMTSVPILSFQDTYMGYNANAYDHTLDYFEPILDDFFENATNIRTTKHISGVDPVSGKVYKTKSSPKTVGKNIRATTKDPLFSSIETHSVSDSQSFSQTTSDAKAHLSRLSIPAKGMAQGDPRIAPWRTIEIKGTSDTTDGYWVVESAIHTFSVDGQYQTSFTCLTDGVSLNIGSSTRPSTSSGNPTINIQNLISTANTVTPTSSTISSITPTINQSTTGYTITPSRWVGQ